MEAAASVLNAFNKKLIPWVQGGVALPLVVAYPTLKQFRAAGQPLPEGVSVSAKKIAGKKIVTKGTGQAQLRVVNARWPDDALEAKLIPMLVCVLDGEADWQCGDYSLHCKAGSFILAPPGVPTPDGTRAHLEGEHGACDLIWFTPSPEYMNCNMCHSKGARHWKNFDEVCAVRNQRAVAYFDDFAHEAASHHVGQETLVRGILLAFFSMMLRGIENGAFFSPLPALPRQLEPAQAIDPIQRARHYMQSHLRDPLTIESVAHAVFMSRSQFAERFRETTGQTFNEAMTELRLHEAKSLLCNTSWAISTVATVVGWKSRRMLQIFERYVGMTPGAFRRHHHAGRESDDIAAT